MTDLESAIVVIRVIYGSVDGLAIAGFAFFAIRYWPTDKRPGAVISLSGALTFAGVLIQLIFPYSAERHAARAASIAATVAFIAIGGVVVQMGLAQRRRRLRRDNAARRAQSGGSADEFNEH